MLLLQKGGSLLLPAELAVEGHVSQLEATPINLLSSGSDSCAKSETVW